MPSVWQNNKILKKWEKKNFKYIVNGDFNYNLADPLINAISKYLNVDKEYIYVGTGISQFINAILGMKCWNTIFLSNIEFALYKRTADINEKKVRLTESKYTNDFLKLSEQLNVMCKVIC